MLKTIALGLILASSMAEARINASAFDLSDPANLRLSEAASEQKDFKHLDELLTPDEIAEEVGIPSKEDKWMNGDYSGLIHQIGRNSNIGNRPLRIEVLKQYQVVYVYQYGELTHQFLASTGRNKVETSASGKTYRTVTPTGMFEIDWMTSLHRSKTWDADMPYSLFFNGGIALHATYPKYYPSLGLPTGAAYKDASGKTQIASGSGGCVRLTMEDAKTLFDLVTQYKRANTVVIVRD
jgi:lipoprotein-anchoring transpeptidase ErfK/SrfK